MSGAVVDVDEKRCKGCGICLTLCPRRVFNPDERGKVKVSRPERCTGCLICDNLCPDLAITVHRAKEGREGGRVRPPAV
ncbi:MAG TPA: 4Fe-4S binding protein [Spirochaetia bacterium]|nr:4Fe-4S binding protein [Spirochaetia bacterium]